MGGVAMRHDVAKQPVQAGSGSGRDAPDEDSLARGQLSFGLRAHHQQQARQQGRQGPGTAPEWQHRSGAHSLLSPDQACQSCTDQQRSRSRPVAQWDARWSCRELPELVSGRARLAGDAWRPGGRRTPQPDETCGQGWRTRISARTDDAGYNAGRGQPRRALCGPSTCAPNAAGAAGGRAAAAAAATHTRAATGHQPACPAAEPRPAYRQEGWCAWGGAGRSVHAAHSAWQPRGWRIGRPAAAHRRPPARCTPPPAGRPTYRPESYSELVGDAVAAVAAAVDDGLTRMEVEFPAVSNVDGACVAPLPQRPCLHWPCVLQPCLWAALHGCACAGGAP